MNEFINYLPGLLSDTIMAVITSVIHNWLPLGLGILTATLMSVYVDTEKLKTFLTKKAKVSILLSVIFGAFTPLCACGTMAVVIGLLSTTLPWGAVMAFLTSSPLMSPDTFIMIAGILNFKFAVGLTIASLVIGLVSGGLTHLIEKNTNFLKDQLRISGKPKSCGCSDNKGIDEAEEVAITCSCSQAVPEEEQETVKSNFINKIKLKEVGEAFINIGLKQILLYFSIFVGIGYLIQSFVPTTLIISLFSANSIFSVPLAALIGLPLYVSGEGAIPLIQALMNGGAGEGAMMAFMITGPATSAWVIAGMASFMKKKVIALYVGYVLIGGILIGYLYQALIALGL